jgi:hypothetical protein
MKLTFEAYRDSPAHSRRPDTRIPNSDQLDWLGTCACGLSWQARNPRDIDIQYKRHVHTAWKAVRFAPAPEPHTCDLINLAFWRSEAEKLAPPLPENDA